MHRVVRGRLEPDGVATEDDVWLYEYWTSPAHLSNEAATATRWGQYLRRLMRLRSAGRDR